MSSSQSSFWRHYPASNLLNGKGLDGRFEGDNCAHTDHGPNQWFSFDLGVPKKLSRVQIVPRLDGGGGDGGDRERRITITIGPSESYDPNEPACLPMIPQLVMKAGFTDYNCTGALHEGKYVKFSRGLDGSDGVMDFCEVKIFTKGII